MFNVGGNARMTADSRWLFVFAFWLVLGQATCGSISIARGQEPPNSRLQSKQSGQATGELKSTTQDDQSKLTDGLLELLNEPSSQPKNSDKSNPPSNNELPIGSNDSSGRSANPLVQVQSKMVQAATMLQQPKLKSTVKVQAEIVQQLDDLISRLEQQEKSQQPSSQRSSQQRQQRQQMSQSENPTTANNKSDQTTVGDQPGSERSDQPKSTDMSVRTKDPSALQQSVWGHLPSRVRTQMESRMVEEFLPSYRAKIEEYYRSLMEESAKK